MADIRDPNTDRFREEVRFRALARARRRQPRAPRILHVGAVAIAVTLHLGAAIILYCLMRQHPVADRDRITVRLLDSTPAEPALPEPPPGPPKVVSLPRAVRTPIRPAGPPAPISAPTSREKEAMPDTAVLFNADGTVRLSAPSTTPQPTRHEENLGRGRELMARGLDCAAHDSDDLAHRESAG